jgi:hypothetical protein
MEHLRMAISASLLEGKAVNSPHSSGLGPAQQGKPIVSGEPDFGKETVAHGNILGLAVGKRCANVDAVALEKTANGANEEPAIEIAAKVSAICQL